MFGNFISAWGIGLTGLALLAQIAAPPPDADVSPLASHEIQRRGDSVERLGLFAAGQRAGHQGDPLAVPADDSGKWFITLILDSQIPCPPCEALKRDFANSKHLKAWADPTDKEHSWAHWNVYDVRDPLTNWRWQGIKFSGFPTLLIQPPANGDFGKKETVVMQITGYDADPQKLAKTMRAGILKYVETLKQPPAQQRGEQHAGEQRAGGLEQYAANGGGGTAPPFDLPSPRRPSITPPVLVPPEIQPDEPAERPRNPSVVSALGTLLTALLGSTATGGATNMLLLGLLGVQLWRAYRQATGQKVLLNDEHFAKFAETLKQILGAAPAKPS